MFLLPRLPDRAFHQPLLGWPQLCSCSRGCRLAVRRIRSLFCGASVSAGPTAVQKSVRAAGAVAVRVEPAHGHSGQPYLHPVGPGPRQPGDLQGVCQLAWWVQGEQKLFNGPQILSLLIVLFIFSFVHRHFVLWGTKWENKASVPPPYSSRWLSVSMM